MSIHRKFELVRRSIYENHGEILSAFQTVVFKQLSICGGTANWKEYECFAVQTTFRKGRGAHRAKRERHERINEKVGSRLPLWTKFKLIEIKSKTDALTRYLQKSIKSIE
jgi:thermostable 8-oxoguanine DNA glycosylase